MAKGFMFLCNPVYNPVYMELAKIPRVERRQFQLNLIECLQKEYKYDDKTACMILRAFEYKEKLEDLLMDMSNLICGEPQFVDEKASASILKFFGIAKYEKIMKMLIELAKNRDALMDEYRKENRNKSDKILEMERAYQKKEEKLQKMMVLNFRMQEEKNAAQDELKKYQSSIQKQTPLVTQKDVGELLVKHGYLRREDKKIYEAGYANDPDEYSPELKKRIESGEKTVMRWENTNQKHPGWYDKSLRYSKNYGEMNKLIEKEAGRKNLKRS